MLKTDTVEGFWKRVFIQDPENCWEWQAAITSRGYGSVHWRGKSEQSHRIAYLLTHKEIPSGLCILHSCNNRKCCNPSHLRAGTQSENILQASSEGRLNRPTGFNAKLKLSPELIQTIQSSTLPQGAIRRMYGLSSGIVTAIKTGVLK